MARWEQVLAKLVFVLLVMAGLGPLLGRATLAQTLALSILIAAGLYVLGDLLLLPRVLSHVGNPLAAAGDGLAAAIGLRYLAPLLGAEYVWAASLALGAAIGASEYFLHRWGGAHLAGRG